MEVGEGASTPGCCLPRSSRRGEPQTTAPREETRGAGSLTGLVLAVMLTAGLPCAAAGSGVEEAPGSYLGLRTAIQVVSDLEAARDWYAEVLGKAPYFDEPFYVGFDVGGFELGLLPGEEGHSAGVGGTRVYWGVNDVESEYRRLLELGARSHLPPEDVGDGIVHASVIDPFGNLLGIIDNPHFGSP